jgi:hypothetical protein
MICGKKYIVQARFDQKTKTCSKKCAAVWQSQRVTGLQRAERITLSCTNCGKEFTRLKSLEGNRPTEKHYCSNKCRQDNGDTQPKICTVCGKEYRSNIATSKFCSVECRKKRVIKICEICGKEFSVGYSIRERRKHCSYECSNKARSINRKGVGRIRVSVTCSYCGKEFEKQPSLVKNKTHIYCSTECMGKHRSIISVGENNPNWNNGASFEPYCKKWTKGTRTRVRAYFGDVCFLCGLPVEEHLDRHGNHHNLTVHHVHYDKQICCNGRPEIMVPLCRSHNSKVNSNKEWWIQYFEKILYAEPWNGKTYFTKEEYKEALANGLQVPDIPRYKGTNKSKI